MKEYFAFQWHITDECDQRCKHCYIFFEGQQQEHGRHELESNAGYLLQLS